MGNGSWKSILFGGIGKMAHPIVGFQKQWVHINSNEWIDHPPLYGLQKNLETIPSPGAFDHWTCPGGTGLVAKG